MITRLFGRIILLIREGGLLVLPEAFRFVVWLPLGENLFMELLDLVLSLHLRVSPLLTVLSLHLRVSPQLFFINLQGQ